MPVPVLTKKTIVSVPIDYMSIVSQPSFGNEIGNVVNPLRNAGKTDGILEIIENPGIENKYIRGWVDQAAADEYSTGVAAVNNTFQVPITIEIVDI